MSVFPSLAFAQDATCSGGECSFPYYGTDDTLAILWADSTYKDDTFTSVKIDGSGEGKLRWYDPSNNVMGEKVLSGPTTFSFPTGEAYGFKLFASSGEFHAVEAWSTNPNSQHIVFSQPSSDSSNGSDCSTAICDCIAQLKSVNEQIQGAVESNGVKLDGIKQVTDGIKQATDGILDELQTNMTPDYPDSPEAPDMEDNKPPMPDKPFKDDSIHFSDQGDAPSPGAFPSAPEPDPCWENGTVCKEPSGTRDAPPSKDKTPDRDGVPDRDAPSSKDAPPDRDDVPDRDAPPSKDAPPDRDGVPDRDAPPSKDAPPDRDGVPDRDAPPSKDAPPNRDDAPDRDAPPSKDAPPDRDDVPNRDAPPEQDPVDRTPPDWTN